MNKKNFCHYQCKIFLLLVPTVIRVMDLSFLYCGKLKETRVWESRIKSGKIENKGRPRKRNKTAKC